MEQGETIPGMKGAELASPSQFEALTLWPSLQNNVNI